MKCPHCGQEIGIPVYAEGVNLPTRFVHVGGTTLSDFLAQQPQGDIRPTFYDGRWFYDSISLNAAMKRRGE